MSKSEMPKLDGAPGPRITIDENMSPEAFLLQIHRLMDRKAERVLGQEAEEKVREAFYLLSEFEDDLSLVHTFEEISEVWKDLSLEQQRQVFRLALDAGLLIRVTETIVPGTPNWSYVKVGETFFEIGEHVRINAPLVSRIVKIMEYHE